MALPPFDALAYVCANFKLLPPSWLSAMNLWFKMVTLDTELFFSLSVYMQYSISLDLGNAQVTFEKLSS